MSTRALSWVLERSPLTGTPLLIHVMLGDLANDQHDNELWMRQEKLAHRARTTRQTVSKALGEMVDAGLLEVVSTTPFGLTRFRLLMDDDRYPVRLFTAKARPSSIPPPPPPPPPARVALDDTAAAAHVSPPPTPRVASHDTARVASGDAHVSPKPTQNVNKNTNGNTNPSTRPPAPPAKGPGARAPFTPDADALARAEWERRGDLKPVIGFVAFRARIDDALAAGHQPADIARVLPAMSNFSRNAFDFVLGQARPGRRLRVAPPISTDRDAPSGRVNL